jgi:hypothetical protein
VTTHLRPFALAIGLVIALSAGLQAQEPQNPVAQGQAAAQQARERDLALIVPLNVRIVISKYQGDKRISSLPYEVTVRTDGSNAQIRMVSQVPVPNMAPPKPPDAGNPLPPAPPAFFSYRDLGTNIDCRAQRLDNNRFALTVTIEDTSVIVDELRPENTPKAPGVPAFRSFKATNATVLRDGQSTQFTAATDKVSGEVIKAEVTLTVVK